MVPPLWFLQISRLWQKYSWIMQNTLKCNEWPKIWVYKTFNIEIQKERPNNSDILQNWFSSQKLGVLSLISRNFKTQKKCHWVMQKNWYVMNDEGLGSRKLLKLKYRRGDQIIQTFCKIGSPQKLGPPSLICRNFKTVRKVLLAHEEHIIL